MARDRAEAVPLTWVGAKRLHFDAPNREALRARRQHPERGTATLDQMLAMWEAHDVDHVAQVARTMAKVYGDAVGPWSAHLSILKDRRTP